MMDEYAVKKLVADLMEALDDAGGGHPDNDAYEAARRWMETGDARPVFNIRVHVSRDHYYRIRAEDYEAASEHAEHLVATDYDFDPTEWLIDSDEDESSFDFDSLEIQNV